MGNKYTDRVQHFQRGSITATAGALRPELLYEFMLHVIIIFNLLFGLSLKFY